MLKALSVRIWICGESLWRSRATVMAASSALLIVCLSGCDLVVVCVCGLTMDAPNVGFPVLWEPSVYMKLFGFHAARKELSGRCGVVVYGLVCLGRGLCGRRGYLCVVGLSYRD